MNVAVLFSGNIRSFDKCKETFIKEFGHLNPDYYVTTYPEKYNFRRYLNYNEEIILDEDTIRSTFSDLNPKCVTIDNLSEMVKYFNSEKEKFDYRILNNGSNDKVEANHFLQFYKVKQALELISYYETMLNKKYDVIIRSRMDLLIKNMNTLDLSDISNKIIIGYEDINRIQTVHPSQHAWVDMLMISSLDNMKKMIDNLLSEFYVTTIEKSVWGYPHGIFESGIVKTNLQVENRNLIHHIKRYGDLTTPVT